jgi:hypothetical protein
MPPAVRKTRRVPDSETDAETDAETDEATDAATVGERFVRALAAKDADSMKALLAPAVDFRGLTPGRAWEASSRDVVVDDLLLREWYEPQDRITELLSLETGTVGHRHRVGYRVAVTTPGGPHLVEQQAYYETDGDRITWLRVLCAGKLPVDP